MIYELLSVKRIIMNPDKQTVIKQDFEDTQAVGLYPFVKGSAGGVERSTDSFIRKK